MAIKGIDISKYQTGVDYKNQLEIYSLLSSLNKNEKTTIISIEHNLETALKYSTHILKIDEGVVSLKNVSEFKEELQKVAGA